MGSHSEANRKDYRKKVHPLLLLKKHNYPLLFEQTEASIPKLFKPAHHKFRESNMGIYCTKAIIRNQ